MRFGEYNQTTTPGLRWHVPWPIESVEIVNVNVVNRFKQSTTMLTSDENIIVVDLVVQYRKTNPVDYLFNVRDPEETLSEVSESAIREVAGKTNLDFIVYIGATPPEVLEEAIDNIQIGKEKRLDGNENILINSFWAWHIKSDKEEAYKESRRELAWRARKLEKSLLQHYFSDDECEEIAAKFESFVDAYFDRSGNIKDIDIEIANKLCRVFTSTGDLADLGSEIVRFKQFEKMGQTHLSLRLHDDPKAALDIIGTEVLNISP